MAIETGSIVELIVPKTGQISDESSVIAVQVPVTIPAVVVSIDEDTGLYEVTVNIGDEEARTVQNVAPESIVEAG